MYLGQPKISFVKLFIKNTKFAICISITHIFFCGKDMDNIQHKYKFIRKAYFL